jgi:hypothetical protein
LKRFLEQLPEPLMPWKLVDPLSPVAATNAEAANILSAEVANIPSRERGTIREGTTAPDHLLFLQRLPAQNLAVARYLFAHFRHVLACAEHNYCTATALASMFAHVLMGHTPRLRSRSHAQHEHRHRQSNRRQRDRQASSDSETLHKFSALFVRLVEDPGWIGHTPSLADPEPAWSTSQNCSAAAFETSPPHVREYPCGAVGGADNSAGRAQEADTTDI